jgi:hypothetical protein
MSVCRINDHALFASEWREDTGATANWISTDGQTWKPVSIPGFALMPGATDPTFLSNGQRAVIISGWLDPNGPATIYAFQNDLSVTKLTQTGELPEWDLLSRAAFGPTGLIITDDNGNTWVGVPVAG